MPARKQFECLFILEHDPFKVMFLEGLVAPLLKLKRHVNWDDYVFIKYF